MKSKKRLLRKSRLYTIIDKEISKSRTIFTAGKIKGLGIDVIQLRDKISKKETILRDAQILHKILVNTKTVFIINDYIDIAKIVDSDGVHLGQNDLPLEIARKLLGEDKIIGISCHNLGQAIEAQNKGADYISIGPIFPTSTKPNYKVIGLDLIKKIRKMIHIPFFAIGGINDKNINNVLSSGVKRVAICSAISEAKNIPFMVNRIYKILH